MNFLMGDVTLSTTDVYQICGICGALFVVFQGLVFLGDRLWKHRRNNEDAAAPAEAAPAQSLLCGFQHEGLRDIISIQLDQIKISNDQLKEMVASFRSLLEDSKLKHEIVVNYLRNAEKNTDEIKSKMDRMHERFDSIKGAIKYGAHSD